MVDQLYIDTPRASVYAHADEQAAPVNELLYGEEVTILGPQGRSMVHIRSAHDGYEGWVFTSALKAHQLKTHKVCALITNLYAQADFKAPVMQTLYFGAHVNVTESKSNGFVKMANGLWIFEPHLSDIDDYEPDFVETALRFIGAPYVWGGRSMGGIDCSGLVQISLMTANMACKRDTHQQKNDFGDDVSTMPRQKGDLVFYDGHVGIMLDEHQILNATARSMDVRVENLSALDAHYGAQIAVKRLNFS